MYAILYSHTSFLCPSTCVSQLSRAAVASLIFTVGVWAISQVGLMAIVKKGYAYLGYAGFISVLIPFVLSMLHIGPFGKEEKKQ